MVWNNEAELKRRLSALYEPVRAGAEAVLDFVYPPICIGCSGRLGRDERIVCAACLERIERTREPICRKCGRQLEHRSGRAVRCPDCRAHAYSFQACRSLAVYRGVIETLIHHLKYRGKSSLGTILGGLMAERLAGLRLYRPVEVIIPVPLHRRRLIDRGYNQSAILAEAIGAEWGRRVDVAGLVRPGNSKPQVDLDGAARWANVSDCFAVGPGKDFTDKVVLLVDDVMTSGATIQACAKALLGAGAESVFAFTLARA